MLMVAKSSLSVWTAVSLSLFAAAGTVHAQTTSPTPLLAPAPTVARDPADQLADNLRLLAINPRDVNALTQAGISAMAVGDANAAIGFLARADQLSPVNPRVKAALGSALVMLERPVDALRLFGEAIALGASEAQIAKDRGLAFDLRGDPRRAQRDYTLALRFEDDAETVRRYALSLGISGDRDAALKLLDPLLVRRDQGAWRARAFVLAMAGNIGDADRIVAQVMPQGSDAAMTPFLRRLASLNPADRAAAVNFGTMPSDGQRYASVEASDGFRPIVASSADGLIPSGQPLGPRPAEIVATRKPEPVSREKRRRPGRREAQLAALVPVAPTPAAAAPGFSVGGPLRSATPPPSAASAAVPPPAVQIATPPPVTVTAATPPPTALFEISAAPPPTPVRVQPLPVTAPPVAAPPVAAPVAPSVAPPLINRVPAPDDSVPAIADAPIPNAPAALVAAAPIVAAVGPATAPPLAIATDAGVVAPTVTAPRSLGSIIASIETEAESSAGPLPDPAKIRAARLIAQRKAEAEAKAEGAAKAKAAEAEAAKLEARKHPARLWVQVATGANDAGLALTFKRLREKSPEAFKGLSGWSSPYKATNRILVGPFKSSAEAKTRVAGFTKAGISTFAFSSDAGQSVTSIGGK